MRAALLLLACLATPVHAETVDIYAAGSLRGLVGALGAQAAPLGIEIHATFGGSGLLRQQIEAGATPDLMLSADMASPDALARAGRTQVPAVAFARNRMCLVAPRALGLTPANLIAVLTRDGVRIRTSKPVADPSGDYAFAMFDLIDRARPGSGAVLKAKATQGWSVTAPPGPNPTAALFQAHLTDVAVTYCSATPDVVAADPDLTALPVPAALAPQPVLGLALLSPKPAAARLALLLLSRDGQAAIDRAGLIALTTP
jgi:molybdate transport system substrate-binding protein